MSEQHTDPVVEASAPSPGAEIISEISPAVPVQPAEPAVTESTEQDVAAEPSEPTEPEESAIKPHTEEPGLLSLTEEEKKPEEKPPEEPTPAESEEIPRYELKFPETVQVAQEPLDNFVNLMREAKISPETAQKIVDQHVAAISAYNEATLQHQHDAFAEMRRDWRNQIMADPELGGSGFRTNQQLAMRALQAIVLPEEREAFDQALSFTGMTDHPAFFRAMLRLGKLLTEPTAVAQPAPPNPGQRPLGSGVGRGRLTYQFPRGRGNGSAA